MKILLKKTREQISKRQFDNDHPGDFGREIYAQDIQVLENGWDGFGATGTVIQCATGLAVSCGTDILLHGKPGLPALAPNLTAKVGFQIWPRISLPTRGWHLLGGTIDPSYRGEILVRFRYLGSPENFEKYRIQVGDKLGRLVPVAALPITEVEYVEELPETDRGEQGFGSGGR